MNSKPCPQLLGPFGSACPRAVAGCGDMSKEGESRQSWCSKKKEINLSWITGVAPIVPTGLCQLMVGKVSLVLHLFGRGFLDPTGSH